MKFKCNHCSEGPCYIQVPAGTKIDEDNRCIQHGSLDAFFCKDKSDFTIKHAKPTHQSDKTFDYLTHTQVLEAIIGSPWDRNSGFSLADVRKNVGDDLVDDPGMPEMVFLKSDVVAAELRAEMMEEKIEDIVVTLVCNVTFPGTNCSPNGTLRVESVPHSQLSGRIEELKHPIHTSTVKVWIAYSEETKQVFWLNDLEIDEPPRLPGYGKEYDMKRVGYRTPSDGVIR